MRECEDCGCSEWDTLYEGGRSYVVCCKCMATYELVGGDDVEDDD